MLITAPALKALIEKHPPNILVADCRFDLGNPEAGQAAFLEGHIPGSVYVHVDNVLSGQKTGGNGRHPLPVPGHFQQWMKAAGITPTTHVVALDAQGSMFAARLWWLLRWAGHQQVSVLDGGWPTWLACGGSTETGSGRVIQEPVITDGSADKAFTPAMATVDVNDVLENQKNPQFTLLDARAPDRFAGQNETLDPIGGHIPRALNHFFKNNLNADGTFKSPEELKQQFEALLADKQQTVVNQCGSGITACHNILALKLAGFGDTALYPGSWSEYCADATRPMVKND